MLFNSIDFIVFFPLVVVGYYILPHRSRWVFLLAASYYFYACWKLEYLALIIFSTLITYFSGFVLGANKSTVTKKKIVLALSVVANLSVLFGFKYFNFFNESLKVFLGQMNIMYDVPALKVLLPVGISFYTFQALSYSVDVYRGIKTPEKHLGIFALYVSFFPQLVAGPIERSTRLLPQFFEKKTVSYDRITSGLSLMLWGFFKKLVIADRLSIYVNEVFNHPQNYNGGPVVLAVYFFAFQIYCDFSGYSDIAIGAAKVFGFDLMKNFNRPYWSTSVGEFWKRWHISLSTWFKDYLYISLGGNRCTPKRWLFNLMVVFIISGLWHGANWTFIVWGGLHGLFLVTGIVTATFRKKIALVLKLDKVKPVHTILNTFIVFHLVVFAWIFFRANTLSDAWIIIQNMFSGSYCISALPLKVFNLYEIQIGVFAIVAMEIVQYFQEKTDVVGLLASRLLVVRWPVYFAVIIGIVLFGSFSVTEFIYFQF